MICNAKALSFHTVTVADKVPYLSLAMAERSPSADHAFANLYLWNEIYHQEIAFCEERALVRFQTDGQYQYLYPIGKGPLKPVLEAMLAADPQLRLSAVTEDELSNILADFPDTFDVFETRDIADYLYSARSLATLSGKKLHGKRNHINAFTAANVWTVKPLTPADFDACRHILDIWATLHEGSAVRNERLAAERAFAAYDALELYGALLIANETPVAFTVGSMLTADTMCVHFEKALPDIQGAYPMINREFVRMMQTQHPSLATVNREDDMGIENLRTAKLSYRPERLLRKFSLRVKSR
ncbi:MAG: DUF2156 domain-containing protein [Ruminococcaceae bacterium]|nr:DUF2156 domain-containing protein [Oscillospiraceae bacterium]